MSLHLSPATLAALAGPAPRYTSYPSVPQWSSEPEPGLFEAALRSVEAPAAVYVHVPFCWKQCFYCGCNMVVSRRQAAGERYLAAMARQIEALPLGEGRLAVGRVHLGGGTPTWLSPDQLGRLLGLIEGRFAATLGAERSIEVHPGVTTEAHLDVLAAAGFDRISIGVQSTDPAVLEAIGREQTTEDVLAVARWARERGFAGVNLDLVHGLPLQTPASMDRTLDVVQALRPERLALYGYAHLPWLRPAQARIDADTLPDAEARMALFLQASKRLREGGWRSLGLDHFALPEDPLAKAAAAGTLSRDFMGHTDRVTPLIGLGPSAISELGDVYVQQEAALGRWYRAVEGDQPLPVVRGMTLTADDRLRRDAIRILMSQLELSWSDLSARHGVDARVALADASFRLAPWSDLGALRWTPDGLKVTAVGRVLLKNLATCFDPSTDKGPPSWRLPTAERAAG